MFLYSSVMSPNTVWNNMSPASVSCLLPLVVFPYPLPHFLGALSGKGNNCACFTQTLQYSHRGINRLPPPACICWALESRVLPMGRVELSKVFPVVLAGEEGVWEALPRMLGESVLNKVTSVFASLRAEGRMEAVHPFISIRITQRLQKNSEGSGPTLQNHFSSWVRTGLSGVLYCCSPQPSHLQFFSPCLPPPPTLLWCI